MSTSLNDPFPSFLWRGTGSLYAPRISVCLSYLTGWFAVLQNSEDRPVAHFRHVEQLAVSKCRTFLIGGSENIEAQEIKQGDEVTYVPRVLLPGDVLTKRRFIKMKTKVKSKGFLSKTKEKEEKFVVCTDNRDREFLISFDLKGVFYIITGISSSATPQIRQMADITEDMYPCFVKLVYGNVPSTPCAFTGVLHLKETHRQSVVIASTVFNVNNVLAELSVDCPLKFRVAKMTQQLLLNQGYSSALILCKSTAETYSRAMKSLQSLAHDK